MSAGEIVVIVTNGRDPSDAVSAALAAHPGADASAVIALVWAPAQPDDHGDSGDSGDAILRLADHPASLLERIVDALLPAGLTRALMASGPGRLVHSLLPSDLGRRVWRRARHVPEAVALLGRAGLVIAADPGGVRTAWFALHRLGAQRAVIAGQG